MSIITKGGNKNPKKVDFQAVEKIKKWLLETVDEEDLGIPVKINSLARQTRKIAKITKRGNQPFFESYILESLAKDGVCEINNDDREVTFLRLPRQY